MVPIQLHICESHRNLCSKVHKVAVRPDMFLVVVLSQVCLPELLNCFIYLEAFEKRDVNSSHELVGLTEMKKFKKCSSKIQSAQDSCVGCLKRIYLCIGVYYIA